MAARQVEVIGTSFALFHVGKIKANSRNTNAQKRLGKRLHVVMMHICTGSMTQQHDGTLVRTDIAERADRVFVKSECAGSRGIHNR